MVRRFACLALSLAAAACGHSGSTHASGTVLDAASIDEGIVDVSVADAVDAPKDAAAPADVSVALDAGDAGPWSPLFLDPGGSFADVWGSGPDDVWAVGGEVTDAAFVTASLIVHWDGTSWSTVANPAPSGSALTSVWGTGPADVWTSGHGSDGSGRNVPLMMHYDGSAWSNVAVQYDAGMFSPDLLFEAGWSIAPNDAWVVGYDGLEEFGLTMHWDGTAWSNVQSLALQGSGLELLGVWGAASNDVWAVGGSTIIVHWDGTTWQNVVLPFDAASLGLPALADIGGSGPNDVWTAGGGAILHYDGSTWSSVSPLATFTFPPYAGVWTDAPNDAWVLFTGFDGSNVADVLHWDGTSWSSPQAAGTPSLQKLWGSSDADIWAVGGDGIAHNP